MYSSYGSGDFISGEIGYEKVTVGNISVDHQKIGLVTTSGVAQERISYSGILGLAYPALTHAFVGNETDRRNASAKIVDEKYDPVFTSMWKSGQIAPMFSIALNRGYGSNNGILALGGIADVPIQGEFAKTKIMRYKTSTEPIYYLVSPEAFSFGPSKDSLTTLTTISDSASIVIDSGATLSYLPRSTSCPIPSSDFFSFLFFFFLLLSFVSARYMLTLHLGDIFRALGCPRSLLLATGTLLLWG